MAGTVPVNGAKFVQKSQQQTKGSDLDCHLSSREASDEF
jgi:hypothetical protein